MTMPSNTTIQTWIRLARAYSEAMSGIERALADNDMPPLSWYDILLELERVQGVGIRQFELEHTLLLKQYGVSRLVERIEREGYLRREFCTDDKRGKHLIITDKGKELRRRMWLIYGPKIEEAVGQKLTQKQRKDLSSLLGMLINKTQAAGAV